MTTGSERCDIRARDERLCQDLEHAMVQVSKQLRDLGYNRVAMSETSGGSAAALITSQLSDWATMRATFQTLLDAAPALRISQLGPDNRND